MDVEIFMTRQCQQINVIKTISLAGTGVDADPYRERIDYWLPDGTWLACSDPCYRVITPQAMATIEKEMTNGVTTLSFDGFVRYLNPHDRQPWG